jgi:hypothetical protein
MFSCYKRSSLNSNMSNLSTSNVHFIRFQYIEYMYFIRIVFHPCRQCRDIG